MTQEEIDKDPRLVEAYNLGWRKGEDAAYAIADDAWWLRTMATAAMQGMLSHDDCGYASCARESVEHAQALLAEINKVEEGK